MLKELGRKLVDAIAGPTPEQVDDINIVSKWTNEITRYDSLSRPWRDKAKTITKRFADERNNNMENVARYNILWSNIQTLKPALFSRNPNPEVERRFKDEDEVGRIASEVLERCLSYSINCETQEFNEKLSQVVLDRLLSGRGTAWVRYVPHFRDVEIEGNQEVKEDGYQITDDAEDEDDQETPQEVYYEETIVDYIHMEDFGHTKARTWEEVTAVWRKTYLDKDELAERFPDVENIPLDHGEEESNADESVERKATIYEIWDKSTETVYWIHKSVKKPLDQREDPLKLEGFFPCPRPLFATLTNDTVIPIPDYVQYQDQADELDNLTGRIDSVMRAVKVAGVYAADAQAIDRLLSEGVENQLIPVDEWAIFAQNGGLQGAFALLPMQEILEVLKGLYETRDRVKQDLYEITGMADIIRGANDPSSTATAENIKANFASIRLRDMQADVARFIRDLTRIMGEVIAGHFGIDTLAQISGEKLLKNAEKMQLQMMQQNPQLAAQIPPDKAQLLTAPSWEDVDALLKNESARTFRIDIETDSTIKMDEDQQQQARMQFLDTIGTFLQNSVQSVQQFPQLAPLSAASLMFAVRSFPAGRQLESAFQKTADSMVQMAQQSQNQPPQPSPEQVKAQAQQASDQAKAQSQLQIEQVRAQAQSQVEQLKHELESQRIQLQAQADQQVKMAEIQQNQHQQQLEAQRAQLDKQHELALQQQKDAHDFQIAQMNDSTARWRTQIEIDAQITCAQIAAKATLDAAQLSATKQFDNQEKI